MSSAECTSQKGRLISGHETAILALLMLVAVPTGRLLHGRALQILALEQRRDELKGLHERELTEQRELMSERTALLTDPFIIEKQARERLGMRRAGEIMLPAAPQGAAADRPARVTTPPPDMIDRTVVWHLFPLVFPVAITLMCALSVMFAEWAFGPEAAAPMTAPAESEAAPVAKIDEEPVGPERFAEAEGEPSPEEALMSIAPGEIEESTPDEPEDVLAALGIEPMEEENPFEVELEPLEMDDDEGD